MLDRSFSKNRKAVDTAYEDVTCCQEWLIFSNFRNWMVRQDWEGKHLDKDLLFLGNKTYAPNMCCFVRKEVNLFLLKRDSKRGKYPLGVYLKSESTKYVSEVSVGNGKKRYLGCYVTPMEAHHAWQLGKTEQARVLLSEETDPLAIQGLNRVISKLQSDYDACIETIDF